MLWKPTYARLFFAPDGGNGDGGGNNGQQGSQQGNQQGGQSQQGSNGQQNGDASGQQGGSGQQGSQSAAGKMLSQDEVNKLIEDRLTRAKSKWDKDAETAAAAKAEKELPEIERLRKQLERLESEKNELAAKTREADGREAVRTVAKRLGATEDSLNAVYRMVKSDIEFDDEGKPKGIDALLAEAKQIAPQLFKPTVGKGDGGAGNNGKAKDGDFMRAAYNHSRGSGG